MATARERKIREWLYAHAGGPYPRWILDEALTQIANAGWPEAKSCYKSLIDTVQQLDRMGTMPLTYWNLRPYISHEDSVARYYRIVAMREAGLTYDAIGDVENLSRERVRQIVAAGIPRANVRNGKKVASSS